MPVNNDSLNKRLYQMLKVQGFDPIAKDSTGETTPVPDDADVFKFTYKSNGKPIGNAWVTVDSNHQLKVYYDDKLMDTETGTSSGFTTFLQQLKKWAQGRQLSFDTVNQDHLAHDMAQREHMKKEEQINEGYYPMGKSASYNDSVPTIKIILQHTRQIQEGEQRFRNISRIFLENHQGERFLAPTIRPGIAQVYARHLAEGGVPNDEKWNHIKSLCEDYTKMAGFVRAVRGNQFNESAQKLVEAGLNHYTNLRETLSKMRGHRGYNQYFESYTPTLMETNSDENLNELFVQETLDPRIESVMPILSRLKLNLGEMTEVNELNDWADQVIGEKLEESTERPYLCVHAKKGKYECKASSSYEAAKKAADHWKLKSTAGIDAHLQDVKHTPVNEAPGIMTLKHNQDTEKSNLEKFDLEEDDSEEAHKKIQIPAIFRKQKGGDWKVTTQDIKKAKERNISGPEGLAALKKNAGLEKGVAEGSHNNLAALKKNAGLEKSVTEEVDTGEYDARKSQPSSKEKNDEVFKRHRERMEKLKKEMDDEDKKKEGVAEAAKYRDPKYLGKLHAPDAERQEREREEAEEFDAWCNSTDDFIDPVFHPDTRSYDEKVPLNRQGKPYGTDPLASRKDVRGRKDKAGVKRPFKADLKAAIKQGLGKHDLKGVLPEQGVAEGNQPTYEIRLRTKNGDDKLVARNVPKSQLKTKLEALSTKHGVEVHEFEFFKKQGVKEGSKEDMSKEVKAMATGTCPHCHGPVKKKEHPTLTQYHCAKCGIRASLGKQGVMEGYSLKKTSVSKHMIPGDPDEYTQDINVKDTDYEIINNKTGNIVGTASWTTNDLFGPGALKITMKNGATRYLDIWEKEKGNPQTAFNRFVKDPKTAKKYKEQGVAEGIGTGIRIEEYQYGKPSPALKAAVKFLNTHGRRGHEYFDFPEYADIPNNIASKLMPEEVDFIQDRWEEQVPPGSGYQKPQISRPVQPVNFKEFPIGADFLYGDIVEKYKNTPEAKQKAYNAVEKKYGTEVLARMKERHQSWNEFFANQKEIEKLFTKRNKDGKKGVAEGLSDTQKKIEDTILKLEQRLKFAKTSEQWDRISARIERLQAGLNRSKKGVAEGKISKKQALEHAKKLAAEMGYEKAFEHAVFMAGATRNTSWLPIIDYLEKLKTQDVTEGSEYTPPKLGTVKANIMNSTKPTVQVQVFKHNTLRGDSYWVTKEVKTFKTMDQANAYVDRINKQGVAEDLDANQKRVGQLGPTEKVGPKGAVGKLVGASESFINTDVQAIVTELDSEGCKGHRGDEDPGKGTEKVVKPANTKDVAKDAEKALNQSMEKAHKKDVKEGQEELDEIIKLLGK